MDKLILASEKIIGAEPDDTFENILITNIVPFYRGIKNKSKIIGESKGFYESSIINIQSKTYRIIKIFPGNVIVDVLKLLVAKTKEITLVGLSGSLNKNFKIGDITCPIAAVERDSLDKEISITGNADGFGRVCQTDGLIQDEKFYKGLVEAGIDFVDMESYFLANFSNINNIKSKLISIVSDNPMVQPFYLDNKYIQNNLDSILDKIILKL